MAINANARQSQPPDLLVSTKQNMRFVLTGVVFNKHAELINKEERQGGPFANEAVVAAVMLSWPWQQTSLELDFSPRRRSPVDDTARSFEIINRCSSSHRSKWFDLLQSGCVQLCSGRVNYGPGLLFLAGSSDTQCGLLLQLLWLQLQGSETLFVGSYLSSCCLFVVFNQSARSDLWPQASTRHFPPNCCR